MTDEQNDEQTKEPQAPVVGEAAIEPSGDDTGESADAPDAPPAPPGSVEIDRDLYEKFDTATRERREAAADHKTKADIAKTAKKRLELAEECLAAAAEEIVYVRETAANGFPADSPLGQASSDPDGWRAVRLDSLTSPKPITAKVLKALAENSVPIETVGQLQDWVNLKGDYWERDIPGVGPAAAGKISDVMDQFWADNVQFCPPGEPDPEPEENDDGE